MRIGRLRPVGEYLPLRANRTQKSFAWPAGYSAAWVDCGTTALGLALRAAITRCKSPRPAVILPAYTCPDVLSAVLWAGARPVLADTNARTPWLDEESVRACLDDTVAAVVAPHFMGMRHPLEALIGLCREWEVALVEDSAQLGPTSPAFRPEASLVVLSFGRGKPVPAGGGMLLFHEQWAGVVAPMWETLPLAGYSHARWKLRALAQNAAMSRPGYMLAHRLPGVGETRFRPLTAPHRLQKEAGEVVEGVLAGWQLDSWGRQKDLHRLMSEFGLGGLVESLGWDQVSPLLRYPFLAPVAAERDRIGSLLKQQGVGATALYHRTLADLKGMPALTIPVDIDNARNFARGLLTVAAHSSVSAEDLAVLADVLTSIRVRQPENLTG
jgi:dTDP-4-amino-4,6-dideoxygalactose transaminase